LLDANFGNRFGRRAQRASKRLWALPDERRQFTTRRRYSDDVLSHYGCEPAIVSKAPLLVEQELAAMRTTNVSGAELEQAKALLLDCPLDGPMRAAQRHYGIAADDVHAAFENWIEPAAFARVVRGPAPQ
jgi:hypothetical protein